MYLARCGIGSRRACERVIAEGRVTVDGKTVTQMGSTVGGTEAVSVDGRCVKPVEEKVYLALHKPVGYLCSATDRFGRPLASDLFRDAVPYRLFHVGRLDFLSSGLIFYTNDGEFARIVTHPSFGIEKDYRVDTTDPIEEAVLERFSRGVVVEGEVFRLKRYVLLDAWSVVLTLNEGKYREIRRVFAGHRVNVKRVHRVRIGAVNLRGLGVGRFRRLNVREVDWFLRISRPHGLDHGATL